MCLDLTWRFSLGVLWAHRGFTQNGIAWQREVLLQFLLRFPVFTAFQYGLQVEAELMSSVTADGFAHVIGVGQWNTNLCISRSHNVLAGLVPPALLLHKETDIPKVMSSFVPGK